MTSRRRAPGLRGRPVPLGDLLADEREDLTADIDGVGEKVITTHGDDVHPEIDVVQDGLRDGLGRADQGVRVAGAASRGGGPGPQRAVETVALGRDGDQPLRPGVLRVLQ